MTETAAQTHCEYSHCNKPLPETANKRKQRYCDNRCRAMAWKLAHPEKWEKMGTPRVVSRVGASQ